MINSYLQKYFSFIKKLFPSELHGSVIAVDIGPGSCRAIEISQKQGIFEVVRWWAEPIVGNEQKALGRLVEAWGMNAKTPSVVTAISGRGTLIRYIDMPRMTIKELKQAFAIEADKYFPFPKDTIYTDCFILDPDSRDKKMMVLVAAVKKDIFDARYKIFKECGLEIHSLTVSSVSLSNVFSKFPPSDQGDDAKVVAIVDVGEASSNVMIVSGGIPRFNRDIFIGVQEVAKRLANIVGIPLLEAAALLLNPGDKQPQLEQASAAVMANLISELRLSFDYFSTEKNLSVGRIIVTGDGALVAGVEKTFKDSFEAAVIAWTPFESMAVGAGVVKDELLKQAPRLVVALGSALSEYD